MVLRSFSPLGENYTIGIYTQYEQVLVAGSPELILIPMPNPDRPWKIRVTFAFAQCEGACANVICQCETQSRLFIVCERDISNMSDTRFLNRFT